MTKTTNALSIYKASAGSGKTYTLTQEYLRLVLRPGTSMRQILAITFTNAASADMKRKIVEALAQLASGKYADWEKLLWKKDTHESLQKRAWNILRTVLHQYQDFSVKTIDSFVQNLIKPFAFELGLPQNYTPNIEEKRLAEEITQRIIDDCGKPGMEFSTDFLHRFLDHQNELDKSLDISKTLLNVVKRLFSEDSFDAIQNIGGIKSEQFNRIIDKLKKHREDFEKTVRELLKKGREVIEKNKLESTDFHGGVHSIHAWFFKTISEEEIDPKLLKSFAEPNNTVIKGVEKGILKESSPAGAALLEVYQSLHALDVSTHLLLSEVQNSIYALALVNRAQEILQEIKDNTSIIPISEFNKRIDQALATENNNFIFERSGARYKHIFIDEFQDTSLLQWKNLKPLLEENLSQGNECLIVGDPKQSIYRFRNADMEQFVDLCEGKGKMAVEVHNLQSNWRSEPGIIAFNNDFYRFIVERSDEKIQAVFKDHEQYVKNQTKQLPKPDPQAVRICLAKKMKGEYLEEWYLNETLEIVKKFPPGEVTVLCGQNRYCTLVANHLVANGIPVSTSDSLILSTHLGLNLLIQSLKYIDTHQDFHKGMCFVLARQMGLWKQEKNGEDFHEEWKSKHTKSVFAALIQACKEQADVYDTVESVLRFWNMSSKPDQFILTFLDLVQSNRFNSIAALVDWWEEYATQTSVSPTQNQGCVNVMSVHKSKGLEFNVVVMPFIKDSSLHYDSLFWTSPDVLPQEIGLRSSLIRYVNLVDSGQTGQDMEHEKKLIEIDNLNRLYVGTTRARKKLFLLCAEPDKKSQRFSAPAFISFFADEHPEYLEKIEDGSVLLPETEPEAEETEIKSEATETKTPKQKASPTAPETSLVSWRNRMQSARIETEENTPEREWGNFIHAILSGIDTANDTHLKQALQAGLNDYPQFRGRKEQAADFIKTVLENPLLKPYFGKDYHIKSETVIRDGEGKTHIPDRVAIKDDTAVVIDYKTGAPHKSHAEQVHQYMSLLQQMGLNCKQGFLVYIGSEPKVERVE